MSRGKHRAKKRRHKQTDMVPLHALVFDWQSSRSMIQPYPLFSHLSREDNGSCEKGRGLTLPVRSWFKFKVPPPAPTESDRSIPLIFIHPTQRSLSRVMTIIHSKPMALCPSLSTGLHLEFKSWGIQPNPPVKLQAMIHRPLFPYLSIQNNLLPPSKGLNETALPRRSRRSDTFGCILIIIYPLIDNGGDAKNIYHVYAISLWHIDECSNLKDE